MSMGLPQWGQEKVLMFSTTPRTSTLTWRNISMALRTSARATVEAVVTTTAPVTARVVLPTPPLPLAMATRFFTPGMGWRAGVGWGAAGGIGFPISDLA